MPHEIGRMFYFGETPWHGLGRELPQPATIDEALKEGGLDWTVSMVPIVPAGEPGTAITRRMAVVRDDRAPGEPGRVVGVVHPQFQPLQNRDGAWIFDALAGQGRRVYHTGGYLRDGEVVWLLARLPRDIRVGGRDLVEPYLLFSNSHDGSQAIDIRLTTVRVVCRNTLSMALSRGAAGKVFRRAHDVGVERLAEEASAFFEVSLRQCAETQALFDRLAARRCDVAAFRAFMQKLLPDPSRPANRQAPAALNVYERRLETLRQTRREVVEVFRVGIPAQDVAPAGETLWGAVNAVTAWVDHQQRVDGHRYAHALFGGGDRLKTQALFEAGNLAETVSSN